MAVELVHNFQSVVYPQLLVAMSTSNGWGLASLQFRSQVLEIRAKCLPLYQLLMGGMPHLLFSGTTASSSELRDSLSHVGFPPQPVWRGGMRGLLGRKRWSLFRAGLQKVTSSFFIVPAMSERLRLVEILVEGHLPPISPASSSSSSSFVDLSAWDDDISVSSSSSDGDLQHLDTSIFADNSQSDSEADVEGL